MRDGQLPLNRLPIGQTARVTALKSEGPARRRLLDLGIVEGTLILSLFRSPSGNPAAYRIRGAVIALRADTSSEILVSAPENLDRGGRLNGPGQSP